MNNSGRHQRKLRNFLLDPPYQLRYVLILNLIGLAMFYSATAVVYISLKNHISITLADTSLLSTAFFPSDLLPLLAALNLLFVFFISLIGIYISHRTVGPIYRFKKTFNEMTSDTLDVRVKLRPGDDFKDLAESFNKMMDRITH